MLIDIFKHALMITGFVFVMMLVIEYINVQTKGSWHVAIKRSKWKQYLISAFLGAIPGCLGAFTLVALYSHRIISLGALIAGMIATSGDEAFVMLAMIPGKALLIIGLLFLIGIIFGVITDNTFSPKFLREKIKLNKFSLHEDEYCECFPKGKIWSRLKGCSLKRGLLIGFFVVFILAIVFGKIGPPEWNWIRVTLLGTSVISLFICITVPEHFLEEHLVKHIVKRHILRIFLWTFGALLVMNILLAHVDIKQWIETNKILIILIACLVGLIPQSGPHLIFVTLFAQGTIPFSVLLANSAVQDGHGMLPLLAESKRGFLVVKTVNLIAGLMIGFTGYLIGW